VPVQVGGGSFQALGDGWGRPIFYGLPETPHLKPKLTSYGAHGYDSGMSAGDLAKYAITNYDQ
jgi:hypothetical protein